MMCATSSERGYDKNAENSTSIAKVLIPPRIFLIVCSRPHATDRPSF